MSASVRDLERSSHVPGAMIYADVGESLAIARPRGKGYLVLVRRGAWPDDDVEAAAVRSDRRKTTPRMWLRPVQPKMIVRPSGDHAGWMPSVAPRPPGRRLQPAPVYVHDPQPIVDSSRHVRRRRRSGGRRGPSSRQNSQSYLTDLVQRRCRRCSSPTTGRHPGLRDFMANESDPRSVARPSRGVLASRRQLLEAAVRVSTIDTGCGGKAGTRYDDRAGLSSRLALAGSR